MTLLRARQTAAYFKFDPSIPQKPIANWRTHDLTPFRCPHELDTCIRNARRDNSCFISFDHSVKMELNIVPCGENEPLLLLVEIAPTNENKPPYHLSSVVFDTHPYLGIVPPLRRFEFVMQLNAVILREAERVLIGDTYLVRDATRLIVENPKSIPNTMAQLLNPPDKKPWWHS